MATAVAERTYEVEGLGAANVVRKDRSVDFEFKVGEKTDKYEGTVDVLAVVTVSYRKKGYAVFSGEYRDGNTFSVSLTNEETGRSSSGFSFRRYSLFSGLGLAVLEAGARFSAKRLAEAADEGFEVFKGLYEDGNEKVLRYFAVEGGDER